MTVLVVPNLQKNKAVEVTKSVLAVLHACGAKPCMADIHAAQFRDTSACFFTAAEGYAQCDIVITVGGDGTILQAAREGLPYNKPLVGVNLGRMGFLATVEPYELDNLQRLVTGNFRLDERNILQCNAAGGVYTALNDIVVSRTTPLQAMDIKLFCDHILVSSFFGDGIIVATPTGSTAYSLSAGGPILDARIAGMVATPICAHSMQSPPMVFSDGRSLRVEIQAADAFLACDGEKVCSLDKTNNIEVCVSKQTITLVSFNEADQFAAIDKKLRGR